MSKTHQKLLREQQLQLEQSRNRSQQDYFRNKALSHYVGSLMFYATDDALIEEGLSQLGYRCSPGAQHYVACFSIDHCVNTESDGKPDIDFLQVFLENSTTDIQITPSLIEKNAGVLLLTWSDPTINVYNLFSTLCVDMEVNLNLRINIGYAGPCEHFTELPKLYTQARTVLDNLLVNPPIVPIASPQDIPLEPSVEATTDQVPPCSYSPNVAKMREYIEQQYMNHITSHDVARHVFLSSGYANACFTNECGTSIFNYIVQVRMNKATQLLTQSNIPVIVIADQVGYSSKTSFYLAFKRFTGISPTEYRAQAGNLT